MHLCCQCSYGSKRYAFVEENKQTCFCSTDDVLSIEPPHDDYYTPTGTSGHVAYNNIPAATYIFRVVAHTYNGERAVTRRIIHVIGTYVTQSVHACM